MDFISNKEDKNKSKIFNLKLFCSV